MDGRDRLCAFVAELLSLLRSRDQDVLWSSFATVEDAIAELEHLRDRIADGDPDARRRLKLLCSPTGAIEEIAISSGWADTWARLVDGKYRSAWS
ncbi:hypothetical protein BAY59_01395 [Prauserella coralliicola]|nr:hypothetical protein BAY59_01395 [Prauserella coralliicola]